MYVIYLKCISLFIGRGVSLANFKMYLFIIIWGDFLGRLGLTFYFDLATLLISLCQVCIWWTIRTCCYSILYQVCLIYSGITGAYYSLFLD